MERPDAEGGVTFGMAAAFAGGITVGALAAAGLARRALGRLRARTDAELESQQDALWRATEAEERARGEREAALRAAEAGDRAKAKFLASVTHEMRTPLSGVIGTTDLLLETGLAPDQRTYASAVRRSATAMLDLVDEILDHSRIEAGGLSLQDEPFDPVDLVEGVAELLAPRAQAKGLDLACLTGPGAATLRGDAGRVRQILLNLAGNAIKFTAQGGVGLRLDLADEEARFSVVDTGPGFEPSDAERLFEEFTREAADPAASGVGLGLAISRKLATAMGGSIAAEGRPGAGATFMLRLPLRHAEHAPSAAGEPPLAGRRILVVSDTPFTGPWLAERLRNLGAEAALAAQRDDVTGGHDVVIIDSVAPPALARAMAAKAAGATRAVVLLTPAERRELSGLLSDGFDGYLVKPIRAASLCSRLVEPRRSRPAPVAATTAPALPMPAEGGLRVLLAEDDPVSSLIALAHLNRLGHSAHHVADGASARAAFAAASYDAALLDLRMPTLDGCAAARAIRAIETAEGRRPALLLAVTANATLEDRAAALAAGIDDVLAKPLERKALAEALTRLRRTGSRVA